MSARSSPRTAEAQPSGDRIVAGRRQRTILSPPTPSSWARFTQDRSPTYGDVAYLAVTVGMSFAVSETEPASTGIRRTALGHALLSYLFGTVVIAVAVNLVTGLGQS